MNMKNSMFVYFPISFTKLADYWKVAVWYISLATPNTLLPISQNIT